MWNEKWQLAELLWLIITKCPLTAGAAAMAAEHNSNYAKCAELGWVVCPYGYSYGA